MNSCSHLNRRRPITVMHCQSLTKQRQFGYSKRRAFPETKVCNPHTLSAKTPNKENL